MTSHARGQRRYRHHNQRRIDVRAESQHPERTQSVGRFLTALGLEHARLEAEAQTDAALREEGEADYA